MTMLEDYLASDDNVESLSYMFAADLPSRGAEQAEVIEEVIPEKETKQEKLDETIDTVFEEAIEKRTQELYPNPPPVPKPPMDMTEVDNAISKTVYEHEQFPLTSVIYGAEKPLETQKEVDPDAYYKVDNALLGRAFENRYDPITSVIYGAYGDADEGDECPHCGSGTIDEDGFCNECEWSEDALMCPNCGGMMDDVGVCLDCGKMKDYSANRNDYIPYIVLAGLGLLAYLLHRK